MQIPQKSALSEVIVTGETQYVSTAKSAATAGAATPQMARVCCSCATIQGH